MIYSNEGGILFTNGITVFEKNGKSGVLNEYGEYTDAIFDEVDMPEMGQSIKVRIGDKWGYIAEDGSFTTDEDDAYFIGAD